jgi:uncharacterized protein (TIGR02145 family)
MAQYKLGDLIVFPDNSKGIVFYVNPEDTRQGWAIALTDLSSRYMMLPVSGGSATGLIVPEAAPDAFNQTSWQPHGKANTLQLFRSGNSPAANAVDVYNGWYIPDIMQLNMIYRYMPLLENDVTSNGGNTGSFLLNITQTSTSHCYASSTPNNSTGDKFYVINMGNYSNHPKGMIALGEKGGLFHDEGYKIRPVREFGNEVEAYWVAPYNAMGEKTNTMTVTPDETTTYDAVVVFGHDTFPATSTVAVHESYNSDTLYEITCMCNYRTNDGCSGCYNAYNSTKSSLFTGLYICPQSYNYYTNSYEPYTRTYTRTTQSQFGCDSTITLILTVVECSNLYTDTLCPLTEDYYFAPFDTTFKPGTVSGIYEHHGTKVVSGRAIDTVAYYDLTILEDYMKGDTTELCLSDNSVTTWENNPNVTITVTDHEVSVTSSSTDVMIDATNASEGIYMIIEKAVTGCDSVTFLHIKNTEGKSVFHADTLYVDHPFDYPLYGHNFHVVGPGVMTHNDTIPNGSANGCDSIVIRVLFVEEPHYDTICEKSYYSTSTIWQENKPIYCWDWNDKNNCIAGLTENELGFFEFPGKKDYEGVEVDTVSYLKLTLKPVSESSDTERVCLSEESGSISIPYSKDSRITINIYATGYMYLSSSNSSAIRAIAVNTTNGDYLLKTTGVNGCDSIVKLHIERNVVKRDTVYADTMHVTGEDFDKIVAGHTFHVTESGVFTFTDTIPNGAANGCDSIIVRYLIVEEPHEDEICDSTFNVTTQTWTDNVGPYKWNGIPIADLTVNADGYYEFPGEKTINGTKVDTTTYLKLTIDPTHRDTNALDICLLGSDSTFTYEGNTNVTISVTTTTTTVTSTDATKVTVYPVKVGGEESKTDFILLMKTVDGCDSVEVLHIETNVVPRDTVYADTLHIPGEDFDKVVANHTFHVTEPGVFSFTDTIPGGANNSCDSITTRILIVEELHEDEICEEELATYTWRGNTLPSSTNSHGYYEFPGKKTINGTIVDTISYLLLTVNPSPAVTLSDLTVCPNDGAVNLTATLASATAPNYTYEWSGELTVSPTPVTTDQLTATTTATVPDAPASCGQTYTMNVKVTDGNGCEATDDATVTVKTPTKPVISTLLTDDNLGCNPTVPTLTTDNFTVTDECNATAKVKLESAESNTNCQHTKVWTATYVNACGLKADTVKVTYTWTEDNEKPVIALQSNSMADKYNWGCNPTVIAPVFTVSDNCEGTFTLDAANVVDGGVIGTGCEKSQTWTASYTDGCGNPATPMSITYYWTEDHTAPVIHTEAVSDHKGCNPVIVAPTFTITDNCEGTFVLNADSVTDGGVVAVTGEPYNFSRTWTAHYTDLCGNKADNVSVTYTWVEAPEVSIICPPDVYDTLAYGDCVMEIYPEQIGTPTINAPADWPMVVSNEIPADNLYQEGETIITWTATDQVCGYPISCQQKVIVVFPKCPDAIDCEGNVYHGVRIDCDCWTQTNLISNCYGDPHECEISGNCDDPIPCVYEYVNPNYPNADENVAIFGKLYCDTAALKDSVVNPHGHIQGICPKGWYLPTVEKYSDLFLHGDALKSPLYWTDGGGDNSTGFSWLPAGWWNGQLQRFEGLMSEGYFLAVETTVEGVRTVVYYMQHDCDEVKRIETHSGFGYSVRCVKEKD